MKTIIGLSALLISLSLTMIAGVLGAEYYDYIFGEFIINISLIAWVIVALILVAVIIGNAVDETKKNQD